jgi:hypothetical protein
MEPEIVAGDWLDQEVASECVGACESTVQSL